MSHNIVLQYVHQMIHNIYFHFHLWYLILYSNDIFSAVDLCHMVWNIDYESSTHWQLIAQLYIKVE